MTYLCISEYGFVLYAVCIVPDMCVAWIHFDDRRCHMLTFRAIRAEHAIWLTMPRLFKVVYPLHPCTYGTHLQYQTYWTKCVLCEKDIREELRCPEDAMRSIKGVGSEKLADNPHRFSNIRSFPMTIDVAHHHDGDIMQATFQHNHAKWEYSCRLQFNSIQLLWAEKRKTS